MNSLLSNWLLGGAMAIAAVTVGVIPATPEVGMGLAVASAAVSIANELTNAEHI